MWCVLCVCVCRCMLHHVYYVRFTSQHTISRHLHIDARIPHDTRSPGLRRFYFLPFAVPLDLPTTESPSMAGSRSPFFDAGLHVLKGAVVSVLRISTGRTTTSVRQVASDTGRILLNSIGSFSDEQRFAIGKLVVQKVREDAPLRVWMMARAEAEALYGDTMYDTCQVPASVTKVRHVNLERCNLNCNINPILRWHKCRSGSARGRAARTEKHGLMRCGSAGRSR